MIAIRSCRRGAGRKAPCVRLGISPAAKGLANPWNPAQRVQGIWQPLIERQASGGLEGGRRSVAMRPSAKARAWNGHPGFRACENAP